MVVEDLRVLEELFASGERFEISSTLTKKYSRPSTSVGRGLRVVCETDRCSCGRRSRSAFTSEVLPAPEGAATTKSRPRAALWLEFARHVGLPRR